MADESGSMEELELEVEASNVAEEEDPVDSSDEEGDDATEFIPGFATVEDFCKDTLTRTMRVIQQSHQLPQPGDDYEYYSSFPAFQTFSKKMGVRMRQCMGKLVQHEKLSGCWPSSASSSVDTDELFESVVDCNDVLLESASTLLDKAAGLIKRERLILPQTSPATSVASWNKAGEPTRAYSEPVHATSKRRLEVMNIPKPQTEFKDLIDNSNKPFVPLLTTKPNALRPLSATLPWLTEGASMVDGLISSRKYQSTLPNSISFGHPYDYEIQVFKPTEAQLKEVEPIKPLPLKDTPLVLVETEEQLQEMVKQLNTVSEFAVDLEHHSYHTFLGLVCLMQISTRSCDFIVDTLKLRRQLGILNDPFTNPKIVKVMHGAEWDVLWLQRDCGVYVVNLFDTFVASRTLGLARHSLAHLLSHYCGVEADKQYQLADWRVRPLPDHLLKYGREDTHYLLFIWDRMRNELIRRGSRQSTLLLSVIDKSRDVCLKRYEKPQCNDDSYLNLYNKSRGKRRFTSHQLEALRLLYNWRDRTARKEDEGTGYVLPNHMLMHICQVLPREPQGVLACCTPVPPLLQHHLTEVHQLVLDALKVPFVANPIIQSGLPSQAASTPPQPSSSAPSGAPEASLPGYIPPYPRRRPSSSETPRPIGPPITVMQTPDITAIAGTESTKGSGIPVAVRAKLTKIRLSFEDPFEQFCVPSPTPPPLLMGLARQQWPRRDDEALHGRSVSAPAIPASSFGILSLSTVSEESDAKGGSSEESKAVSSDLKDEGSSGSNTEDVGEATAESNLNREEAGQKGGRKRKRNKRNTGAWREHFSPGGGPRKRGQREFDYSEPTPGGDQLNKKSRKSSPPPSPQQQPFEAFDYSKKTFADLAGSPHKASRSHFDPNQMEFAAQSSKQHKKGAAPRSLVHQRSGQRSSTYTRPNM